MDTYLKKDTLIDGSPWDRGRFVKNFDFDTIYNITQESELQRYNCASGFFYKSAVIKYHQLLSKVFMGNCFSTS